MGEFNPIHSEIAEQKETLVECPSVSEVCKKYGVYIVHGISPNFSSEGSQGEQKTWQEKLDKVLQDKSITLSCSSVKEDNSRSYSNFWSPLGVILKEGDIVNAFRKDMGSIRIQEGQRAFGIDQPDIYQAVEKAIYEQTDEYNEIAITNCEIDKMYFISDAIVFEKELRQDGLRNLIDEAERRGMSLALFYGGKLYKIAVAEREFDYFVSDSGTENSGIDSQGLKYESDIKMNNETGYQLIVPQLKNSDEKPQWLYDCYGDQSFPGLVRFDLLEFYRNTGHFEKRVIKIVTLGDEIKIN